MKQIFVEGIISVVVSTVAIAASVNALSGHTTQQAFDFTPFQATLNRGALNVGANRPDQAVEVGDKNHTQSDNYAI
ncbi:MAG: hypothetical protein AAGF01_28365 [Cyanobacteria bacterium P01_G01_bin.38]